MKNTDLWHPTKYVFTGTGYRASRDRREVALGSRLIADITAHVYARLLQKHAHGILLDFGCGKVPLYGAYRDLVVDVVCIDWRPGEHVDHQVDLNQQIPLPDGHFDTILATDVLEHLACPDLVFREIARLLKPTGKAIISAPFLYWLHEEPHDYFRYSEYALVRLCEQSGLGVLLLEPYGGASEVLADMIGKLIVFSRLERLAVCRGLLRVHLWLSQAILRTSLGKRLSTATARSFPLGYCLVVQKGASGPR